jgi:hypothetical protein
VPLVDERRGERLRHVAAPIDRREQHRAAVVRRALGVELRLQRLAEDVLEENRPSRRLVHASAVPRGA